MNFPELESKIVIEGKSYPVLISFGTMLLLSEKRGVTFSELFDSLEDLIQTLPGLVDFLYCAIKIAHIKHDLELSIEAEQIRRLLILDPAVYQEFYQLVTDALKDEDEDEVIEDDKKKLL